MSPRATTKQGPDFEVAPEPVESDEPTALNVEAPEDGSGDVQADRGDNPPVDRQNGLRQAYGTATAQLREKHRTEFDALYVAAARALGLDYKPKPTPEQKAQAELEELLTKFPHLRDKVTGESQPDTEG